ncbi:hypothetical protein [Bacillus thuringiensis]|nr:hypothetical protein [Bacillus thuringiensis]
MFRYCENTFGFKGVAWDKIKHDYNLELLGEIFEILDISCSMYDDE